MTVTMDRAREVKAAVLEQFSRIADVVGVGITRIADGYGVKVNLSAPPKGNVQLPTHVQGVPIKVEVVGKITPLID